MNADFLAERVDELCEHLWRSLLGARPVAMARSATTEFTFTVAIAISGEWRGRVLTRCSEGLLVRLATRMFGFDCTGRSDELWDTLTELANMVGGNLKTMLPESEDSTTLMLSLPVVLHELSSQLPLGSRRAFCYAVDSEIFEIDVEQFDCVHDSASAG